MKILFLTIFLITFNHMVNCVSINDLPNEYQNQLENVSSYAAAVSFKEWKRIYQIINATSSVVKNESNNIFKKSLPPCLSRFERNISSDLEKFVTYSGLTLCDDDKFTSYGNSLLKMAAGNFPLGNIVKNNCQLEKDFENCKMSEEGKITIQNFRSEIQRYESNTMLQRESTIDGCMKNLANNIKTILSKVEVPSECGLNYTQFVRRTQIPMIVKPLYLRWEANFTGKHHKRGPSKNLIIIPSRYADQLRHSGFLAMQQLSKIYSSINDAVEEVSNQQLQIHRRNENISTQDLRLIRGIIGETGAIGCDNDNIQNILNQIHDSIGPVKERLQLKILQTKSCDFEKNKTKCGDEKADEQVQKMIDDFKKLNDYRNINIDNDLNRIRKCVIDLIERFKEVV